MNGLKQCTVTLGWVSLLSIIVAGSAPHSDASENGLTTDILTLQDVARMRSVGSVVISPDGVSIAYTLSVPREPSAEDNGPAWAEIARILDRSRNTIPRESPRSLRRLRGRDATVVPSVALGLRA